MGRPAAADAQFRVLAALDTVNFLPGTSWNYNNGGYVLLSVMIERLSGMALGDFMRTRIFAPIGMNDTVLRLLDTDTLPNSAALHVPDGAGGWTRGVFGPPVAGEGGIASTVDDMLRWLKHMGAPVIGSVETWAAMRTPLTTHGYGLGLTMSEHRGLRTVHHAGGVIGGACQMLKVVDHDLDLIIITNGQSGVHLYDLVDKIIDACIPGMPRVPADVAAPAATGIFFSPATGRALSLSEHEGRQVVTIGGMTLPRRCRSDRRLPSERLYVRLGRSALSAA
jgi:CubicO group peptidase (beta-lactamase class C family)